MKIANYIKENKNPKFQKFIRGCKTKHTMYNYTNFLRNFMEFLFDNRKISTSESFDELASFDSEKITDCMEEWVVYLGEEHKPNSIQVMIAGPNLFFIMNRITWHKDTVHRLVKREDDEDHSKPITTSEIAEMLGNTGNVRDKALIHFFASTGVRPGALIDPILRIKHLKHMANPSDPTELEWCYAVHIYDSSKENYWAFLTPEAAKSLKNYINYRRIKGESITPNSILFSNIRRGPLTDNQARSLINNLMDKSGTKRTKYGKRFDKPVIYMFRKRFNGILKMNNNVNYNIAEKLMGHKRGLDGAYLKPTIEECFTEFVKAIPDLTISDRERHKIETAKDKKKIEELAEANKKLVKRQDEAIKDLQRRIDLLVKTGKI